MFRARAPSCRWVARCAALAGGGGCCWSSSPATAPEAPRASLEAPSFELLCPTEAAAELEEEVLESLELGPLPPELSASPSSSVFLPGS